MVPTFGPLASGFKDLTRSFLLGGFVRSYFGANLPFFFLALFEANPHERRAVEHEVSFHDFQLVLSKGKCGYPTVPLKGIP